jgi:hypothetical protein
MTMFKGYAHMVDFFTSFDWWDTEPHDELVNEGNYCLARPGKLYAVYLPRAGRARMRLAPGRYEGAWWEAATGKRIVLPAVDVTEASWTSPPAPGLGDWALLLRRREPAR